MPTGAPEGRSSALTHVEARTSTTDSVANVRKERATPTETAPEDRFVCCGEASVAPVVHLGSCPHTFYLARYATLHVKAGSN